MLLAEVPGLAGVTNSFDLSSANAIVGRRHDVLAGEGEIEETIAGLRYRVSAGSFFQVNAEMLAKIFAYVEPWLAPAGAIVDLYCGAGTFSGARRGVLPRRVVDIRLPGVTDTPRRFARPKARKRNSRSLCIFAAIIGG